MNKKNILYLTHRDRIVGGGEISLFELISNLDREKYSPFLVLSGGEDMTRLAKESNVVYRLLEFSSIRPKNVLRILLTLIRLVAFIIGNKIHIVHANTSRAMLYGAIVANLLRASVVWHVRIINKDPLLDALLFNLADIVVCNSKATSSRFKDFKKQSKIKIVHNGLDPSKFHSAEKRVIFHDIPKSSKIVLNIGRLDPWKRQDLFIQMAKIVQSKYQNVKFVIIGEDKSGKKDFFKKLENLVDKLSLKDSIIFMGEKNNIPALLSEGDVLVLTSKEEPFGRVIIEAGASRKPVVAFKGGGVEEIIDNEKTGFVVEDGNVEEMAKKVLLLLASDKLRTELGLRGRDKVLSCFTSSIHVEQIDKIYSSVLNSS